MNMRDEFENFNLDTFKNELKLENKNESITLSELQKLLLSPKLSGLYVSRIDIKHLASDFGEGVAIDERKRMCEKLFKAITEDNVVNFFEILINFIDNRLEIYKELSNLNSTSKDVFMDFINKADSLKSKIVELKSLF